MTYIAAGQLAVIVILVVLLTRARDHEVRAILDVMAANDAERAELLTRIQHPQHLPLRERPAPATEDPVAQERRKALAKVGTIEAPQ